MRCVTWAIQKCAKESLRPSVCVCVFSCTSVCSACVYLNARLSLETLQRRHAHTNTHTPRFYCRLLRLRKSTLICWHDNWSGIFTWPRKYGCEEKMNEQWDMNKKQQHKPTDSLLLITGPTVFAAVLHNVLSHPLIIKWLTWLQLCISTGVCIHMRVWESAMKYCI